MRAVSGRTPEATGEATGDARKPAACALCSANHASTRPKPTISAACRQRPGNARPARPRPRHAARHRPGGAFGGGRCGIPALRRDLRRRRPDPAGLDRQWRARRPGRAGRRTSGPGARPRSGQKLPGLYRFRAGRPRRPAPAGGAVPNRLPHCNMVAGARGAGLGPRRPAGPIARTARQGLSLPTGPSCVPAPVRRFGILLLRIEFLRGCRCLRGATLRSDKENLI